MRASWGVRFFGAGMGALVLARAFSWKTTASGRNEEPTAATLSAPRCSASTLEVVANSSMEPEVGGLATQGDENELEKENHSVVLT